MLNGIFNKTYTKDMFLEELYQKDFDEKKLKTILDSGFININTVDEEKNTFLHLCLKKSKFKSAIWLIENGIDISIINNFNQSVLDMAVEKNNYSLVSLIVSKKVLNIDKKDKNNRTILQDAIVLGQSKIAKLLIDNGADINNKDINNRNSIFDALSYGDENFINFLLEQDNLELNNIDIDKNSIMHHPEVEKDDNKAIKLIKSGANTTIQNKNGETYLCNTALRGEEAYPIVKLAVDNGADINSRVIGDNTILMELIAVASKLTDEEKARRESLLGMSKKVVDLGAQVDATNKDGNTALFEAINKIDFGLASFLLSVGVNPNIKNKNSQTALFEATYKGIEALDIILLLLKYDADPTIKNDKQESLYEVLNDIILDTHGKKKLTDPFVISKIKKNGQYILILKELLENNEKDLNFLDSSGNPLFFSPLLNNHFPLFKLYIQYGLNIETLNIAGHNIFFEYVFNIFKNDIHSPEFQSNLSMLISSKVDHNAKDENGDTVLHKIMNTKCDISLFNSLTQIVLFDYTTKDNIGRTVAHSAIWHNKQKILSKIANIDRDILNIPDNYGILPITYAALLGSQELVLLFIRLGSNVRSGVVIHPNALKKFKPMLKNLDKLKDGIKDETILTKIDIVIDQVKRDFKLI